MARKKKVNRVLVLRTVNKNFQSYSGFRWPQKVGAVVTALDWEPTKNCGNGLHGFLRGQGEGILASREADAVWMAVWVDPATIVELNGKVKFPSCGIACTGALTRAVNKLRKGGGQ